MLIGLYGLSVVGGNAIGPLISGFLVQSKGVAWRYHFSIQMVDIPSFWLLTILCGANWVFMIFFMPETKYTASRSTIETIQADYSNHEKTEGESETTETVLVPKRTFWENMAIFPQVQWELSWVKLFCRPFVLLAFPTVLWVRSVRVFLMFRVVLSMEWPWHGV